MQLPGTAFARRRSRYEIDAFMLRYGVPHIFFTLNPGDQHSPLLAMLNGFSVEEANLKNWWDRAVLASKDPVGSARFFQTIVRAFLKAFVKAGDLDGGVFGAVSTYYGTIEAQGRGALHLHILIWLRDCPIS